MTFGAAFLFDEPGENALRGVWQAVADAGLSSFMLGLDYPPHLTLFMAEAMDVGALRTAWSALAERTAPLALSFPALGVFPGDSGVVYLSPTITTALLDLHSAYWQAALPYLQGLSAIYEPGVWVPHVTVGYRLTPQQTGAAVAMIRDLALPKTLRLDGILLGAFNLEGDSQLHRIRFSGPER